MEGGREEERKGRREEMKEDDKNCSVSVSCLAGGRDVKATLGLWPLF